MKLAVLFEDNHMLVVSKPAGLTTQDAPGEKISLESLAKEFLKEKYQKQGAVFLHAIHRLDKPVSGVVVFAKTSKALSRLNAEIRLRKTEKEYLALVDGQMPKQEGVLENVLFHGEHKALIREGDEGVKARLSYKVLKAEKGFSLIRIQLETGRYHQIRAQLSYLGNPISGDLKYGSSSRMEEGAIALHHQRFVISHPITHEKMEFIAPPPDWLK